MTQMRIFKNEDMNAMERGVNFWLEQNSDRVKVISVTNGTIPPSTSNNKMLYTTTITYSENPISENNPINTSTMKILHD